MLARVWTRYRACAYTAPSPREDPPRVTWSMPSLLPPNRQNINSPRLMHWTACKCEGNKPTNSPEVIPISITQIIPRCPKVKQVNLQLNFVVLLSLHVYINFGIFRNLQITHMKHKHIRTGVNKDTTELLLCNLVIQTWILVGLSELLRFDSR